MKKANIIIFLSLSLIVVFSFVLVMFINDYNKKQVLKEKPLVFEDKVFEKALKKTLNKKDADDVYQSELDPYVGIVIAANHVFLASPSVAEKNVVLYSGEKFEFDATMYMEEGTMTTLTDLKYFPNLTNIKIYFQKKIDYSTFGVLSKVNNLYLYADDIKDLSFMDRLTNITYLNLNYNKIEDLTPLKNLTKLKIATLNYNNISDITTLEELTTLVNLQLNNNEISNITALSSLTNLTSLSLQNNNITDVSPIKPLVNLENLLIKTNPITNMDSLNTLEIIPQ